MRWLKMENNSKKILSRISVNDKICHGQPCIKGHRIMVWQILEMLEGGANYKDILEAFPSITENHIKAALHYVADLTKGRDNVTVNIPLTA